MLATSSPSARRTFDWQIYAPIPQVLFFWRLRAPLHDSLQSPGTIALQCGLKGIVDMGAQVYQGKTAQLGDLYKFGSSAAHLRIFLSLVYDFLVVSPLLALVRCNLLLRILRTVRNISRFKACVLPILSHVLRARYGNKTRRRGVWWQIGAASKICRKKFLATCQKTFGDEKRKNNSVHFLLVACHFVLLFNNLQSDVGSGKDITHTEVLHSSKR